MSTHSASCVTAGTVKLTIYNIWFPLTLSLSLIRSRHDKHNPETFGADGAVGEEGLVVNPTGDPVLDQRMLQEQEVMAQRRKEYNASEDQYAGLMSQRDKQWIINIQLNQLKCDNPYVDDYYYTMYQAR